MEEWRQLGWLDSSGTRACLPSSIPPAVSPRSVRPFLFLHRATNRRRVLYATACFIITKTSAPGRRLLSSPLGLGLISTFCYHPPRSTISDQNSTKKDSSAPVIPHFTMSEPNGKSASSTPPTDGIGGIPHSNSVQSTDNIGRNESIPNKIHDPKVIEMRLIRDKSGLDKADPAPLIAASNGDSTLIHSSSSSVMIGGNGVLLGGCCAPPNRRSALKHGITDLQAMMNLIKGLVGTGILSLPLGFCHAGLWTGLVLLLIIVCINIYCMHQLVGCAQSFCKITGRVSADYGEVAELCLSYGPVKFRRYAKTGRVVVNAFIFATQLGFCCVYFVFIAENIRQVADPDQHVPLAAFIAFTLPFVLALCSIRHLKYLAVASAVSNALYAVGFAIVFQYIFRHLPESSRLPAFASWRTLPLFFGSVMFSFEGISLVLPIENKMFNPQNFLPINGVMNTSSLIVLALYAAVGFFGYIRFGDQVADSITLNMPTGEPLYQAVRIMFAVAVFLTYAVQFYVPLDVIMKYIRVKFQSSKKRQLLWEYGIRMTLVVFTFCMAELIPHLGLFISLVGSVMSAALALIFPPILETLTFWESSTRSTRIGLCLKNGTICILGLVGFVTGTYASLEGIASAFSAGADADSRPVIAHG